MSRTIPVLLFFVLTSSARADDLAKAPGAIRFATFNASLNRDKPGQLVADLSKPDNTQARNVAEIVQRVRPEVLLVNEFDYDASGNAVALFQKNYLGISQNGAEAIAYPYHYVSEVNTGVPSGFDLDHDGKVIKTPGERGFGNDAFGFGQFPGQYGLVLYSMFPIDQQDVRDYHKLLWKDMPGALLPTKADGTAWYSPEVLAQLRLSSKTHLVIPIKIGGMIVHALVSHPTPPAFDGLEKRNAKRNHDEIRLWADYLSGSPRADYLRKALSDGKSIPVPKTFIIMGDMNADPVDGSSVPGAIQQILNHPHVNSSHVSRAAGALEASQKQREANMKHRGDPAEDTADFNDSSVGNLRVDYVLPSKDLEVIKTAIFWPVASDLLSRLVSMEPVASSDHRLVYLDVRLP